MTKQDDALGAWMAAALSDGSVCVEMKRDIEAWMEQFNFSANNAPSGQVAAVEVGQASSMPGTHGFTMAVFNAEEVPMGVSIYVLRIKD